MECLQYLKPERMGDITFSATVGTRGNKEQAKGYTARLSFFDPNHKVGDMTLPLYIPVADAQHSERKQQAQQLAEDIGREVVVSGRLDIAELIRSGRLPFKDYVQASIERARAEHGLPDPCPYKMSIAKKGDRLDLRLIDDSTAQEHHLNISLPTVPERSPAG